MPESGEIQGAHCFLPQGIIQTVQLIHAAGKGDHIGRDLSSP